jgi:gluconokinase
MIIIIMGVSGSGKSTVGTELASRIHAQFYDADDYHPPANIDKMSRGIPLQDDDRWLWLETLSDLLRKSLQQNKSVVMACSALKQSYRDKLNQSGAKPVWIYLRGTSEMILGRLQNRSGHFMKPEMLKSQFEALEEPVDAMVIDAGLDLEAQLNQIDQRLNPM